MLCPVCGYRTLEATKAIGAHQFYGYMVNNL